MKKGKSMKETKDAEKQLRRKKKNRKTKNAEKLKKLLKYCYEARLASKSKERLNVLIKKGVKACSRAILVHRTLDEDTKMTSRKKSRLFQRCQGSGAARRVTGSGKVYKTVSFYAFGFFESINAIYSESYKAVGLGRKSAV